MSHRAHALVFTAARLPSLPSSERYELWLMGSSGPRAAGMLPAPRAGMTAPVIVSGLRAGDEFAVSAEPASRVAAPHLADDHEGRAALMIAAGRGWHGGPFPLGSAAG